MAFQVSPGVQVKEIDATAVVPAVSTSIGGFAGSFNWGPTNEVVSISSEQNLADTFGSPDDSTFKYFLTAASFLKYGNALKVVRVTSGHKNATANAGGLLIKNDTHYVDQGYSTGGGSVGHWAAKHPGSKGNSLKVSIVTEGVSSWSSITYHGTSKYSDIFDAAPGTSTQAANLGKGSIGDELHVAVIDEDGVFSGTAGTVLETFSFASQAADAKKPDGTSNYYVDVVNTGSEYVRWMDHPSALSNAGGNLTALSSIAGSTSAISDSLVDGTDDNTPTTGEIEAGYDLLADSETVDVGLLFAYPDANAAETIAEKLITVANARKDCMAFVSPPIADSQGSSAPATDVMAFANGLSSSSYASCDSSAVYVYDKYNDTYRWIGASGHIAGLCAGTDRVADAWFSPAGVNRGQLLGVTKLAWNPVKADRDTLYKGRVNPLVSLPGQGTILYGDKTLLSKPSAFDRINVRRLFIVLEKAISTAAKAQLFEFNDEFTRADRKSVV